MKEGIIIKPKAVFSLISYGKTMSITLKGEEKHIVGMILNALVENKKPGQMIRRAVESFINLNIKKYEEGNKNNPDSTGPEGSG